MRKRVSRLLICWASFLATFDVSACGVEPPTPTEVGVDGPLLQSGPPLNLGSKIVFGRNFVGVVPSNQEIFVMNPDGSGQTNVTNHPAIVEQEPSWSPDGRKIVFASDRDCTPPACGFVAGTNVEIYVMNADGSGVTRLTNHPAADLDPHWSPDGRRIAFLSTRDGVSNREIYVMDADGSNPVRLTNSPGNDQGPRWSPNGRKIAFQSNRDGNNEIYVMNADGSMQTNLTNHPADDGRSMDWSPDGTRIAFSSDRDGNREVYVMNADGSQQTRLTNDAATDEMPSWSPDGSKIMFSSSRDAPSFPPQLYVMNADGSAQMRVTVSPTVDFSPEWGRGGL